MGEGERRIAAARPIIWDHLPGINETKVAN